MCPVDCIYEIDPKEDTPMLPMFIHVDECIDCGACEPECPVDAIYEDDAVPAKWDAYIAKNYKFFGRSR